MGNIGPGELLLIALIAMLLFGAGRIASLGKGLGQGIRNFKEGLRDMGEPTPLDEKAAPARDQKEAPNQLGVGNASPEAPLPIEVRVAQKVN